MKILVDTHYLIWALTNPDMLTNKEVELFLDPNNDFFYSTISIWEIAIKRIKNTSFNTVPEIVNTLSQKAGFSEIRLNSKHVFALGALGNVEGHKDPFDRMLLAQAKSEGLNFLTRDKLIHEYKETCVLPFV